MTLQEIKELSDEQLQDLARQPVRYEGRDTWAGRTITGYDAHNAHCELSRRYPLQTESDIDLSL